VPRPGFLKGGRRAKIIYTLARILGSRSSPRVTTDSSGNHIGQQCHFPFGESWYAQNTTTKWQFTAYERDSESGNDYAMARYNVNRLGRFSSPDPLAGSIANPQSLNRYPYGRLNPVNFIDPAGMDDCLPQNTNCDSGGLSPVDLTGDPGATIQVTVSEPIPWTHLSILVMLTHPLAMGSLAGEAAKLTATDWTTTESPR
jgi:RHS repeat-associated protein